MTRYAALKSTKLHRYNCPFCRGVSVFENTVTEAVIRCAKCGATIKARHGIGDDTPGIELVHAKWNARG